MSSTVRGAIDPLLGYLSSAIRDEAQLLGGVRRDAQFIKDELESMNGFLHNLGKEHECDHQVRAWMKQVRDLANDTQYCVDLYGRRVGTAPRARGVGGQVQRAVFFLQTIPARHQVATQIRELKSRARDVGERRQRYGVQVLAKATTNEIVAGGSGGNAAMWKEADAYRRGLVDAEPLKDGTVALINWLHKEILEGGPRLRAEEPEATARADDPSRRPIVVIAVVAPDEADGSDLAKEVYNHSSVASLFDCKAFVPVERPLFLRTVLHAMIQQLRPPQGVNDDQQLEDMEKLKEELQKLVKGKRFFLVLVNGDHPYPWNGMKEILDSSGCSPGSAILVTTKDSKLAECFSPNRTITHSFVQFCFARANRLVSGEWDDKKRDSILRVLEKCDPDLLCMKLLLGTLYADPYMSKKQLEDLCTSLGSSAGPDGSATSKKHMTMMKFCYDKLPKTHRSCLLYLSIFPKNFNVRRTSLVRRWVAEGHVIQGDGREALDRADRCFDDLVARGFVAVTKAGNLGNVISCKVHHFVHDFIAKVVKEESFGDRRLPSKLARHLSISSDIQWHRVSHQKQQSICNCFFPVERQGAPDGIIKFIESLPTFSRVARVKVMDLDYCKHLKDQHLKIICNNLLLLKYLSIRSTEISRLPSKIKKLQQLETLDIRQTKIPPSATRGLLLPMLKHLLAGPISYQVGDSPEEELSTVQMPSKIGDMTEMETLYHVEFVDDGDKLKHVKNLKRLRKLGVVIHGKQDNIDRFLWVVTELSECLRALSVWVRPPRKGGDDVVLHMGIDNKHSLPKLLETLSINGITKGLPDWIKELPHLAEITLSQASLSDGSMRMLGMLEGLRCLTLRHKSYTEDILTLKTDEFKNINFLVIEGASDIKGIIFETGTAPKIEKIVWAFTSMDITTDTITGLNNLGNLKDLEFRGKFDPSHVQRAVAMHPNSPNFRYMLPRARSNDASVKE